MPPSQDAITIYDVQNDPMAAGAGLDWTAGLLALFVLWAVGFEVYLRRRPSTPMRATKRVIAWGGSW